MNLLLLGSGKTGSQVAEVAAKHKHHLQVASSRENLDGAALHPEKLRGIDAVLDFTAPHCVLENIEGCVKAGKNMVDGLRRAGTRDRPGARTGETARHRLPLCGQLLSRSKHILRDDSSPAAALRHDYSGQIFERHHVDKKDAPSGTAIAMQNIIRETSGTRQDVEITSFREGEVVGLHEIVLESKADRIYLCHDAKSRRGFAEGAVFAANGSPAKKASTTSKTSGRAIASM